MAFIYTGGKQNEHIMASCRPEINDLGFCDESISEQISAEDLEEHCLYLTSRLDELMEETTSGKLSMGNVGHSLEVAKLVEVANSFRCSRTCFRWRLGVKVTDVLAERFFSHALKGSAVHHC